MPILLFVLILVRRKSSKPFAVFATFLVAYGVVRLFTDALREDARFLLLTVPQWTSLVLIGIGIGILARPRVRPRQSGNA
jgi:prolipoprotein diacylglyceryltransferase